MFGILCSLVAITGKCVSSVKDIVDDYKSKSEARTNNQLRYYDSKGASRLVSNDSQVYDTELRNGDRVTKDINGNVIINYDYPIRQKEIEKINLKLQAENAPVKCVGYFYDLYPKHKNFLWTYIPKKQLVYETSNKDRYIRERSNNNKLPKYIYINLKNGDYELLDSCEEEAYAILAQINLYKHNPIIVKEI